MGVYVWGFASGALVVVCEIAFKMSPSYWARAWLFLPLAVAINYSIYRLVQGSPSLPAAFIVFSVAALSLRIGASLWLGHPIGPGTWAAIGLLLVAAAARQVWG